ncbi:MAG: hypothetical protein HY892_14845 [Deltaproteobacteria bacterium]|nr:hypothetical protein [Deltaproteobacteria bacterium]
MKPKPCLFPIALVLLIGWGALRVLPAAGAAQCDTLAGPVVQDARMALETGDVTPVLKWVGPQQEKKVRAAFQKALAAKTAAPAIKEKAEMEFFGTLVRIHREGEGAPYTGLKPGAAIEPVVAAADKALETGTADDLIKQVNDAATAGIRQRFERVVEKKKHAGESVAAGREYVAAYVDFTHHVEGLYQKAAGGEAHHQDVRKKHPKHGEVKRGHPDPQHKH